MKDDSPTIKAALSGDPAAFALLVKEYQGLLYNVILRIVENREAASDLTQEAFLKSFRNLKQFDAERARSFKPWLLRIGTNTALDHIRRQRPEDSLEMILEEEPQKEPASTRSVADEVEDRLAVEELSLALSRLPLRYRQAFVLRYQHDLTYEEISKVMQENENTVRTLLFRAKDKLRTIMENKAAVKAKAKADPHDTEKKDKGGEYAGSK